jgi:DNA repair exonuclease SbcCD nuclease subunit
MRLPALLTSDLHFVAEPACDYRWGLWPWLRTTAKEERVKTICILGDLVDRKDNHPAVLVNRLADEVKKTRDETGCELCILAGNHDWLKEGEEFFKFLRHMDGIHYITEPWEHPDVKGSLAMFLPFAKDPALAWKDMHSLEQYDFVFMHQTIRGSLASNGQRMETGDDLPDIFDGVGKIYSGDIHVPQIIGGIEYVGSPYHVHFGDNFKPRVVLLESLHRATDLHIPDMPRRVTLKVTSLKGLDRVLAQLDKRDQVKVRIELKPEELHEWKTLRRGASDMVNRCGMYLQGIELIAIGGDGRRITHGRSRRLAGMSPEEALTRYVEDNELGGDALHEGFKLL